MFSILKIREQLAEYLGVTPKFCSDIGLGAKGMSVPTLCKISKILRLKTDYILFGKREVKFSDPLSLLLESCTDTERIYAEQLLKTFLIAMNAREEDPENPLTKTDTSSENESLS